MINSNRSAIPGFILCALILMSNIGCSEDWGKHLVGDVRYNQLNVSIALKKIRKAQITYKDKQCSYGSIDDLIAAKLIDSKMANKEFYGYNLKVRHKSNSYEAIAIPVKYKVTGSDSFFLDESGVIRAKLNEGNEAGPSDMPIREQ